MAPHRLQKELCLQYEKWHKKAEDYLGWECMCWTTQNCHSSAHVYEWPWKQTGLGITNKFQQVGEPTNNDGPLYFLSSWIIQPKNH